MVVVGRFYEQNGQPGPFGTEAKNALAERCNRTASNSIEFAPKARNYAVSEIQTLFTSQPRAVIPAIPLDDSAPSYLDLLHQYISVLNVWAVISFGNARETVTGLLPELWPLDIPVLLTVASTTRLLERLKNVRGFDAGLLPSPELVPHNLLRLIPDNNQQALAVTAKVRMMQELEPDLHVSILEDHSNAPADFSKERSTDIYHTEEVSGHIQHLLGIDREHIYRTPQYVEAAFQNGKLKEKDILIFVGYPQMLEELADRYHRGKIKTKAVIATDGCDSAKVHGQSFIAEKQSTLTYKFKAGSSDLYQVSCPIRPELRISDVLVSVDKTVAILCRKESNSLEGRKRRSIDLIRAELQFRSNGAYSFGDSWSNTGIGYLVQPLSSL